MKSANSAQTSSKPFKGSLGLAAFTLACCLAAARLAGAGAAPAKADIDALFADYDSTVAPGCTLGIFQGGKLAYARGYGMANLEYGIANSRDTVFRIASVSKQFVAAAIALLDEAGQLDLDDPVQKYFPDMPDYGSPVTLRQMIHHTSGIRDYLVLAAVADWGNWYLPEEAIHLIERQQNLNFEPESDYLYSNSGYLLLGAVVEQVTGQSLREWSQENLFAPLGMHNTHFQDDHTQVVKSRADGYALKNGAWHVDNTQLDMVGDGGIFTTVEDLQRWHNNFTDNRLGQGRRQLIELLETPARLSDGEDTGYAFGLGVNDFNGVREIEHGGSWVGFRASLNRYPEHGLGVAVLCNRADADPEMRARQVAALYLGIAAPDPDPGAAQAAEPEPALPADEKKAPGAARLEAFAGSYYSPELEHRQVIALAADGLVARRRSGPQALTHVQDDSFTTSEGVTLAFTRDAQGTVTGFDANAGRVRKLHYVRE